MVDVKWEENQGLDESAEEVVNYCKCSLTETPCNFPYCEADLLCEHNFYGNRSNFDIWDIKRTSKNDLHPTMKPIPLPAKAIENSSRENDIVLDLFGGSGSTLIACEQLNRRCYTMELDEKYATVIIDRWEKFTGEKAEKILDISEVLS